MSKVKPEYIKFDIQNASIPLLESAVKFITLALVEIDITTDDGVEQFKLFTTNLKAVEAVLKQRKL